MGFRQSIGSMVRIAGSIAILGWLKYSTKIPIVFVESERSSLDSSSALQLFSLGIWMIWAFLKHAQIVSTSSWYFFKDGSRISYSSDICRVTSCESAYTVMYSALTQFAIRRPASKASYSAALFVIGNRNLREY